MFAYWMCAFDSTGKGSKLAVVAEEMGREMYGKGMFDWQGVLSHSPFTEQLGTESYGSVRQTRFDEQMVVLDELYNGDIPEDMIDLAWRRSAKDNVIERQNRVTRDNARSDAERAERYAQVNQIRANYTPEQNEESAEKMALYYTNMMEQMNEADYIDFRARNNASQRKSRAKKKAEAEKNAKSKDMGAAGGQVDGDVVAAPTSKTKKSSPPKRLLPSRKIIGTSPSTDRQPSHITTKNKRAIFVSSSESESEQKANVFVSKKSPTPKRRLLSRKPSKGKRAIIVSSSESESEAESSEGESLGGFIVDDDVDD